MEIKDLEISKEIIYAERMRILNARIIKMAYEKTSIYGGNKIVDDMEEQLIKTYYEGMGRKFERMPSLMKEYRKTGSKEVLDTIVDTIVDINVYSLMSLVDLSFHTEELK